MSATEDHDLENDLAEPGGNVRLFLDATLGSRTRVALSRDQAHYLLRVMRAKDGDRVRLFNGRDGEWRARVTEASRKGCALLCDEKLREQSEVPDLWLAFAPIKRTPADYVTQKATELGVRVLQPVITHRTIARRVNAERMHANAVEAAEQSERLSVPQVRPPKDLPSLLSGWPTDRTLIFCDESGEAPSIAEALKAHRDRTQAWGLLTGPEGGFDEAERKMIRARSFTLPVSLGPRIMRADTAAIAGLAIWQAICGDWL